jgi:hypothetical protein
MPPVCSEDDDSDTAPFDPDKAPPDPPETLNIFKNRRYISKLIQWGLEAPSADEVGRIWWSAITTSQRNPSRFLNRSVRRDDERALAPGSPLIARMLEH